MKKILLAFTLIVNAYALENDNKREVSDIMYLPKDGTSYFEFNLASTKTDSTTTLVNNNLNYSSDTTKAIDSALSLGHTFLENLFVSVDIDLLFSSKNDTTYGPGSTKNGQKSSTNSIGASDPSLKLKYRILQQKDMNFILDIKASFSPKLGDAKQASEYSDGNNYRGGSQGSVGIDIGRKFENFSFSMGLDLSFNSSRDIKDLSSGYSTKVTSSNDIVVHALTQFRPTKSFFFNAGLSYQNIGGFDQLSGSTTTNITIDPYVTYVLAIGALLTEDVAIRAYYQGASASRSILQGSTRLNQDFDISSVGAIIQNQF